MFNQKWLNRIIAIFFFLLPWQTVYQFRFFETAGHPSSFAVFGIYTAEMILFLIVLFIFFQKNREMPVKQANIPVLLALLFLLCTFLSSLFSEHVLASFSLFVHFFFAFLLFSLLSLKGIDMRFALLGFVAGLIIPAAIGIAQFLLGTFPASAWLGLSLRDAQTLGEAVLQTGSGERLLRAYGTFPHPNIFGGYLAIGILAILSLWYEAKKPIQIVALGSVGFLFSITLLFTFSRSAWLGLLLALLIGAILRFTHVAIARKAIIAIAGIFIVGTMILSFATPIGIFRPGSEGGVESRSIQERREQYRDYSSVVSVDPTGIGIGAYPWAVEKTFPGREWHEYQPIHNVPLLAFAELGIFGFLAGLFFLASVDRINFSRFPNREAIIACMMGNVLLFTLFFDHYLWSFWPGLALSIFVLAFTLRAGENQ